MVVGRIGTMIHFRGLTADEFHWFNVVIQNIDRINLSDRDIWVLQSGPIDGTLAWVPDDLIPTGCSVINREAVCPPHGATKLLLLLGPKITQLSIDQQEIEITKFLAQ